MRIFILLVLAGCAAPEPELRDIPLPALIDLCQSEEVFETDEGPKKYSDTRQCKEALK